MKTALGKNYIWYLNTIYKDKYGIPSVYHIYTFTNLGYPILFEAKI